MTAPFVDELQAALGGAPDAASRLSITGAGDLPSAYRVTDLASATIGVSALAVLELAGGEAVEVDRGLASSWFGSAVAPVGWSLPTVWDPLARNYLTSDGWIRLHTNAPHHRAAALRVLGVSGELSDVRRAVSRRTGDELERDVVEAGGCAAVMRSRDEWTVHPQGIAVAAEPLVGWTSGAAGARGRSWVPQPGRPLAGLRVLDLTRVLAGPVATRALAALGADVLRIDPPFWDEPAVLANMTLGKRTARLDLRESAGVDRLRALLADADVLVHGYRLGALDALGFTPEERQRIRPGLVDVSLDAYGFTGPWAGRRGFDSLVQMSAGIAHRGRDWAGSDAPHALPVQALDHSAGYLMLSAVLRALVRRDETGAGWMARTSLARVAELLVSGGELPVDGPLLERRAPTLPLDTPWGPARLLEFPVSIDGVDLAFARGPVELGSSPATWE